MYLKIIRLSPYLTLHSKSNNLSTHANLIEFKMRLFICFFILFTQIIEAHASISFLTISDIHYGANNTPGDGHDTDKVLLDSSLNKFKLLSKNVDFILTLGDFPTHRVFNTQKTANYIQTVFQGLYKANSFAKPMFYIAGNNDSIQGNYHPFSQNGESPLKYAKNWQGACVNCEELIIDKTHMEDKGYYSSYVKPNHKDIILIVLNATQFTKTPWFLNAYPNQKEDALAQFKWLAKQLEANKAKQLLIAMHEPPGKNNKDNNIWHEEYLMQFINILNNSYKNYGQITLLSSHTHMDDIRKIKLKNGNKIFVYATPSISRIHHNNPGMKIFYLNNEMQIKDYTTYYTQNDNYWSDLHYNAIKGNLSIFPNCHNKTLTNCLNNLSDSTVCKNLNEFYGVKSPRVNSSVCKFTYPVN